MTGFLVLAYQKASLAKKKTSTNMFYTHAEPSAERNGLPPAIYIIMLSGFESQIR